MALAVEAATVAGGAGVAMAASTPGHTVQAPVETVGSSGSPGAAEAPDEASALLAARLQNRAIEVLDDRTDASQTFAEPDGSLSYSVSALPARVKQGRSWVPVDATLQRAADGSVSPAATESALTLSGGGSTRLATLTVDGKALTLSWPTVLPAPTLSGATATYADVLASGVDLDVTATVAGGIDETLVVKNATAAADPALSSLALTLSASSGLTVATDAAGNTTITDSAGRAVITSPAPVMWDSSTDTDAAGTPSAAPASDAAFTVEAAGARSTVTAKGSPSTTRGPGLFARQARVKASLHGGRLLMVPDKSLLTGKGTHYPVFIDPTFVTHSASGSTLHFDEVQQAYSTTSNWDADQTGGLAVGYQGFSSPTGIERTYYNLSVPSSIYGAHILSAKFNAKVSSAAASGKNTTTVNAFSTGSISSSTTWANQPAKSQSGANPNYPSPNAAATFTTPSASPNLPVTFDVTSGMQYIADIHNSNWTLGLYNATETDDLDFVRFADNPTFSITYDAYAAPSGVAVSPSNVNPYSGIRYATSLTPVLSAKITDADAASVKAQFEVTPNPAFADTTYSYTATSAAVASGGTAKLTVPTASVFPAGKHLRLRARGYDGSVYGAWSGYTTFTMNTGLPNAPSISCDPYSQNTWTPSADSGAQCTLTTTSADGMGYAWGLDDPTAAKRVWDTVNGNGGDPETITVSPTEGWHKLYARTVDSAGNISAATTEYDFGVGTVGLTSPSDGDRPARRVSLTATGKDTYTGVTYQYRQGETDTWHDVPVGDVTKTSDGSALAAWPVAVTGGSPAPLTWNITSTLPEDSPVDIRAAFTDGTTTAYTQPHTVTVDRNAGTAPTDTVGPGDVNDLTGDFGLSATDASEFDMTVTRTASSRRPTAGSDAEGQDPIFGPQWTSGTTADLTQSDWAYIHKTSSTSVGVVDVDGDETGFTATTSGGWKPEPGAEDLTLTGSLTGSFTLKDEDGTTTTFAKVTSSASTWQVTGTQLPTDDSTTKVVSEAVTVNGATLARPTYVIAPTSAATAATCQTTPSTAGCRMLQFVYATNTTATGSTFGDYTGRVAQIKVWATSPGATTATASVVAQYAYDTAGQLRQEWDPRISPALKTTYDYDSAGRVATLTPPGELPWTMTYGQAGYAVTAGPGMLLSASRPTLTPGTQNTTDGGTATTNVVYDVPLTGSHAPNAMGSADVAAWGQSDVPADATAIFPADVSPSSHTGSDLAAADYTRATITYTDASGQEVNDAAPGHHITTTEYDHFGNTIRQLTAANRELALATDGSGLDELKMLDIDGLATADRAEQLSTTSVYSTDGLRETDEYGPLHQVTLATALAAPAGGNDLPAGSTVSARQHTANTYDQGRPTDGTATVEDQITSTTVGAYVTGFPTDADQRTTTTAYDWVKGLPTSTTTDPNGLHLVKTTTYDAQGRITKTTLPKSNGADAGTTVTTYYSATGTGACNGRPEWADFVCSTGPSAAITGAGTNPTQLPTKTTTYDRYGDVGSVIDLANGVTRTLTNTYDAAERLTTSSVTGGVGTAVPDSTTVYDPANGQIATTSAAGETISHTYDTLGRQIGYNDGNGNTTTTWYDALDRPTKTVDSAPSTTTYTYDTTQDPRGLETSRTDSVAGTFTATYDSDANQETEGLPGGYTLTTTSDEAGARTSRTYVRDSDGMIVAADSASQNIQGQQATNSSNTSNQAYSYDASGRLTEADDSQADTIAHRTYTFDDNSNRTNLTTTTDNPDGTIGAPSATAYTYDSADRLETVNGIGVAYDAFGRTTSQASGDTLSYYTNDLVRQQTTSDGTVRQTWTLDADKRSASWTTETDSGGTWTQTATKTNHYGSDSDLPSWTAEDASSTLTRNVRGISGDLDATTTATGGTILQLTNLHGDVAVQLPLDAAAPPTALSYDEYGNLENDTPAARYGWLGAKERSAESLTGVSLMGFRLYDPSVGRFLQLDPILGGSANAYDYAAEDPINASDPSGSMVDCGNGLSGSQCNNPWNTRWKYQYSTTVVGKWHKSPENRLPRHVKVVIQTLMGFASAGTFVEGDWYRNKDKVKVYGRYYHGRWQLKRTGYTAYRQQGKVTFWAIYWGDFSLYTPWLARW